MALTDQQSYVYWLERDGIAIATLDRTATSIANEFTGPPGSKTVTVFAVKLDSTFHDTDSVSNKIGPTESPSIPSNGLFSFFSWFSSLFCLPAIPRQY